MVKDYGQDMTRKGPILPPQVTWDDVDRDFPGAMEERPRMVINWQFGPFLDRLCAAHIRQARQTRAAAVAGKITIEEFRHKRHVQDRNFHARYALYMRMLKCQ